VSYDLIFFFFLIQLFIYIYIGNTTKDRDLNNMYRIKSKELKTKRFLIIRND